MITLAYLVKLGITTQKTSIRAQKINNSLLETYNIFLTRFLLFESLSKVKHFKKSLLLAIISIEVILGISFRIFSNVDKEFVK